MTITWLYLEISSLSLNLKANKKSMKGFLERFILLKTVKKFYEEKKSNNTSALRNEAAMALTMAEWCICDPRGFSGNIRLDVNK